MGKNLVLISFKYKNYANTDEVWSLMIIYLSFIKNVWISERELDNWGKQGNHHT